jgi:O-antigen ligase
MHTSVRRATELSVWRILDVLYYLRMRRGAEIIMKAVSSSVACWLTYQLCGESVMLSIRRLLAMTALGALVVALGWYIPSAIGEFTATGKFPVTLALLALPILVLLALRPVLAGIVILAFAFVNPSLIPPLMELGEFSLRYVDVAFGVLICVVCGRLTVQCGKKVATEFRALFAPLLPFLLYVGASLAVVRITVPDFFFSSLASYLRLIYTATFAFWLYLALSERRDITMFHRAIILLSATAVVIGGWQAWTGIASGTVDSFSGRFGGLMGFGTLGLVSGLLVVYALLRRDVPSHPVWWIAALALGLLGLLLAKSASSTLATAGACSGYMVAMRSQRVKQRHLLRWLAIGGGMTMIAIVVIWILRPGDADTLMDESGGSYAQRLMIADAGLRIFRDHPIIGVGWKASATETVIGTPTLNAALMQSFKNLPTHFFFIEKPTSLHNMYIQLLAELGIIGFAVFVRGCVRVGRTVKGILRNIPEQSPDKMWARFYALGLVFLLIWWNTNPLYGGQTESLLAFTFIGALAAVAQCEKHSLQHETTGTDGGMT